MEFTEKDEKVLRNYLQELANVYVRFQPNEYPVDMYKKEGWMGFLGLPKMRYSVVFHSREEVHGRIVSIAHLLAVDEIHGIINDRRIRIKL